MRLHITDSEVHLGQTIIRIMQRSGLWVCMQVDTQPVSSCSVQSKACSGIVLSAQKYGGSLVQASRSQEKGGH